VKECSETLFGLSFRFLVCLLVKSKKRKKFVRSFFAKTAKIFLEQPTLSAREKHTRLLLYIYNITASLFIARGENYALYLLHLPLCCDSLSSRVVEVFERAVVR
jgi:hypothetical protein